MLYYFYWTTLFNRLLSFTNLNVTARVVRAFPRKHLYIVSAADRMTVSCFYYTGATWCVLAVRVLLLPPLDPRRFLLGKLPQKALYKKNVTGGVLKRRVS